MLTFKKFLKQKGEETNNKDLGKDVIVFENLKGVIVGIQGTKRWVKIKGMQRQLISELDYRILE